MYHEKLRNERCVMSPVQIFRRCLFISLIFLVPITVVATTGSDNETITVFVAKKIVTMDSTNPTATAVAIRGRRIVSVGTLENLKPWLDAHPHRIDDRFKDKVLMPGLIDPHLHPLLGAIQFGTHWITPEAWSLHDEIVQATTSEEQYRERLKAAIAASKGDDKPIFITWGWNMTDHGPVTRDYLDSIEKDKPVMVWQRSVHEAVFNTAALNYLKLKREDAEGYSDTEINWEEGHFLEAGLFGFVLPRLAPYLMNPTFIDAGFQRNKDYLLSGGITTAGDLATGKIDWNLEIGAIKRNFVDVKAPLRMVLVPAAHLMALNRGGLDEAFSFIDKELSRTEAPPQIVYGKRIKLFADGAMLSQRMRLREPGYIDGHEGEWITPPEDFEAQARKYWNAGYRIHVHANGDEGIAFTLDVFEVLQAESPRGPNALVLEHYGYADDNLNRRVADFGASVSANPYYLTGLGDTYAEVGLGYDRARRITPLAGLVDRDVPVALHSDFGMAPARPLFLAWSAVTRKTWSGNQFIPPRGLTRDEALRAITIDAAYILGLDADLGSIQSGKLADFAVLEEDPTTVDIERLKEIPVWGVVFEGVPHRANAK